MCIDEISHVSGTEISMDLGDCSVGNLKKQRKSIKGDSREYRDFIKHKRNSGMEYMTNKGKIVLGRKCIPLSKCRADCKNKIDLELQDKLFTNYWSMKDYNKRVSYIYGLITSSNKKTQSKKECTPEKQKNRVKNFHYFVPKDGILISVCKICFLKIFGETAKFTRTICSKKVNSPVSHCTPDKRGRAEPHNKITPEVLKCVLDHINQLPSYESHYCRQETSKKYLPPYFTLQLAYNNYLKTVENPVSRSIYVKYFKLAGLKVKNPKKDTCSYCDRLKIQISNTNCSNEQKIILTNQQTQHHAEAEEAFNSKRNDISTSVENTCVITFDLQQCLPTPSLESSVAFYKRQLWTYNFTVHNTVSSKAVCYIWNETIAKRGANDIGSSLFHYLKSLPSNISHVTMYSDCCPRQNKNSIIMAMCIYFLEHQENIKTIDHKFMVPGHSRMECDSDHARIEKARKRYPFPINHPHDWAKLISWAGKDKFTVVEMKQNDYFDFNSLLKSKYQIKKNEAGNAFVFRDVKWLRYTKQNNTMVQYKTSLKIEDNFINLNMARRRVKSSLLPQAYSKILAISDEKKKRSSFPTNLIPDVYHHFYKSLESKTDVQDPIISSEDDNS